MKKNLMMRAASVLLVAVMLTTCAISGTFAKYVTADDVDDSARVAKWGVEVTATGDLFAENYINAAGGNVAADAGELTVISSADPQDNVVAPGTKNETGMTFTIKGTPEVDTKLTVKVTSNNDIKLAAGDYEDPTTGETGNMNVPNDYYPVVFTLKNGNGDILTKGNIAAIKSYFDAATFNKVYDANTVLDKIGTGVNGAYGDFTANKTDGEYTLTWEWAYGTPAADIDNTNIVATDKYDTILGNAAVTPISGATTEIDFTIQILVEQVD